MIDVDAPAFVIVAGPPASGKSTLAAPLAESLRLPLLAKDTIKEGLMEVMPPVDVEGSRQIGRAAVGMMFALAATSPVGAVLEGNLHRSRVGFHLRRLGSRPGRLPGAP